ncbi:MAG: serine/threonine-protein kinase [Myxococcota bacterium]
MSTGDERGKRGGVERPLRPPPEVLAGARRRARRALFGASSTDASARGSAEASGRSDHVDEAAVIGKGRTLGRYAISRTIGHGAMGTVFEAYDQALDRSVALKLLRSGTTQGHAQRLRREAQALAKLSHPNVVHVYEVGQARDQWFIAMELVPGQTLRRWQQGTHGWRECVRVYGQAAQGLGAAHAAGLVHRDFKPDNCIIDEHGRVRVLDFGLVRDVALRSDPPASFEGSSSEVPSADGEGPPMLLTQTGMVLGTAAYMPPEQLDGRRADARSDQFSFCVSLYEALYGQRPFVGSSLDELTHAITRAEVRPPPRGTAVPGAL